MKSNTFGDKVILTGVFILAFSMLLVGGMIITNGIHNKNINQKNNIPTYTISSHIQVTKDFGGNWNIGTMSNDIIISAPSYNVFGDIGNLLGLNSNVMITGTMKNAEGNIIKSQDKMHFGLYGTETANLKFTDISAGEHYITIQVIENNQVAANKIFEVNIGGK